MEMTSLPGLGGDWEEDEEYEDDDADEGQEDEENFSALLQHQMNATWRSNLLPRSRFLELTVFKKMLSQGLHLTRHDGGIVKPTTVFADPDFRNLWWYKSVGLSVSSFPISSLLAVGTATDPKSGSTRQDVIDIATIQEEDYPVTFSLTFSGARKKKSDKADKETPAASTSAAESAARGGEKHDVFFTCDSVDLFHLVLDGFGMILEHAEAAAMDGDTAAQASMKAHKQLGVKTRALLLFHQLYRPEHHPNHPRRVLRNGQEVEVLYSSEYVVEFNGQLMRLPNPFFGPGMNCRGKVVAFDEETDNYTVAYVDGPFEHDELPSSDKKNFPKGTVFEYVKRANMIVALGNMYTPNYPIAVILISLVQLVGAIMVSIQSSRPEWMFGMQIGFFEDGCPDVRAEIWRLWTYQFIPINWVHFGYTFIVQLLLGLPVNAVHGNLRFLILHQGLAIPLAYLSAGFADANKVVSNTVAGASGGLFAIFGVFFGNLIMNYGDSTHGLIPRWARLILLLLLMFVEFLIGALMPNYESSLATHIGGFVLGCLFSVVIIRNISNTHFERTYLVPASTWTLSAYIIFAIGWYAAVSPPTSAPLFPGSHTPPCCWTFYDCEMELKDTELFQCIGTRLTEIANATAIVKDQTCDAFQQYAGLQIVNMMSNSTR